MTDFRPASRLRRASGSRIARCQPWNSLTELTVPMARTAPMAASTVVFSAAPIHCARSAPAASETERARRLSGQPLAAGPPRQADRCRPPRATRGALRARARARVPAPGLDRVSLFDCRAGRIRQAGGLGQAHSGASESAAAAPRHRGADRPDRVPPRRAAGVGRAARRPARLLPRGPRVQTRTPTRTPSRSPRWRCGSGSSRRCTTRRSSRCRARPLCRRL